ncbi:YsnF/AvaK domain-containing protein [Paraburkholderia phenoliruptrix]|uniref:YsnF/AvaK domain-containing protein n=1 Tax=Paraburkholderia phenoliruptrix TaxID=252970 RepID=UPI001C4E994B|nr:YsnF/AvaK domain-containing protein [Paraburkholderia phenoliruptrix]MBW0448350.1 YsnF/AvaK domain-containing protein [Paraburkholderia phenoliruptrix]MBW9099561.1 YsnF/AvaK domain-containing protein [Paraburkholderia phenoliruptrix]
MTQTLLAVFDSFQHAQTARGRLEAEGVASADITVHARDAAYDQAGTADTSVGTTTAGATSGSVAGHEHEGMVDRIEHFFKRLFGDDDRPEEAGHYQEAVRRGGALLSVDVNDESSIERVRETLYAAGAVDIDSRVAAWRNSGYTGYDRNAPAYTDEQIAAERKAFPVVEESLEVGKREVNTGGVRVYSRVTTTPVSESVELREEHATIERRATDRPATAADLKEGSVEIRETAEQAVVAKTARVVEEVIVGKESSSRTETVNDTVRGTEVEVERVEGTVPGTRVDEAGKKPI